MWAIRSELSVYGVDARVERLRCSLYACRLARISGTRLSLSGYGGIAPPAIGLGLANLLAYLPIRVGVACAVPFVCGSPIAIAAKSHAKHNHYNRMPHTFSLIPFAEVGVT